MPSLAPIRGNREGNEPEKFWLIVDGSFLFSRLTCFPLTCFPPAFPRFPLLDTLRLLSKAQGGIAGVAEKSSMSRQALNKALSPSGNPRLRTFQSVLESLGLRMSFKPVDKAPTEVALIFQERT